MYKTKQIFFSKPSLRSKLIFKQTFLHIIAKLASEIDLLFQVFATMPVAKKQLTIRGQFVAVRFTSWHSANLIFYQNKSCQLFRSGAKASKTR